MKKVFKFLLVFITLVSLVMPVNVLAAGISSNKTSMTITKGSTGTFTITASDAAGRIDFSTDNASVASINVKNKWLDSKGTKSVTVTVSAKSVGTAHITVKNTDVAAYSSGADISGKTITITVNVVAPKNYSSNNNFATFGVKNYDDQLKKTGDNAYSLSVRESVSSVELYATAEDAKATVSGTGVKELQYGENKFSVTVTAENGSKNTRTVSVFRKDGIYVEDIVPEFNAGNDNFNVIKDDDHVLDVPTMQAIKDGNHNITVNEYDKDGNVTSYVKVNGQALNDLSDLGLDVTYVNDPNVDEASGYLKGIYVNAAMGNIREGVTLGIPSNGLVPDGRTVNVYKYNPETNQLELVVGDILVDKGVIELEGIDTDKLFITPGTYVAPTAPVEEPSFHTCIWFYIAIASICVNGLQLVLKKKKRQD